MALALNKYKLVVTFTESSGDTVQRTYEADSGAFADIGAFLTEINTPVTGFLAQLDALTDAVISAYQPSAVFVEGALVLPVGVENQNQALLSAKIDGDPTDSATLSIPAPVSDMFLNTIGEGRNVVNITYAPLAAFMQNFSTGGWFLSDGEHIEITTLKGKRRHVKSSGT